MRILLLGEYSRFHNSLKEGLMQLGHEVMLIGNNDFKNYPLDISLYAKVFKGNYLLNKFRQLVFRISKLDLAQLETAFRFYINRKKLVGFDVVQLVNEYPIESTLYWEKKLLQFIFDNNKKVVLSSCGDDYNCVKYMLDGKFRYSILTPCETNPSAPHCQYTLKYVTDQFQKLHDFVYENITMVIAGDMDYSIPLDGNPKSFGLIPYPINTEKLIWSPLTISDKIIIFHGINEINASRKGNSYFEAALVAIGKKYPDKVDIITARSIPYAEYIQRYDSAHIVLDQVWSYDQGYNALEAMAKGKLVFTGAETEFETYYSISEPVNINAKADVTYLIEKLSWLIENPQEIVAIGKRARNFVEKEHDYIKVAQKYLNAWTN
ncbi:MAG: glycosyltransferase [Flavobacterium sp.]|nr:glycosyltransferase [Flavobacterium sp.]